MTIVERHVFTVIGDVFYHLVKADKSVDLLGFLRQEQERLNSLQLYRSITDSEYDYLSDVIGSCIEFIKP